ncbi:MAG: hypothetical protein ACRD1R_00170 [Acidobacteriota bacterium]
MGWDQIERIEVLKNNQILHTFNRPQGRASNGALKRVRFLLEWGWDARKEHDWSAALSGSECRWTSKTEKGRYDGQARRYGDVMAFEVECPEKDGIQINVTCDELRQLIRTSPADVLRQSSVRYMENIPATNDGNYWRSLK